MANTVWTSPSGTSYTINTDGIDKLLRSLKGQHAKIIHDGVMYGIFWELGHMTPSGAFLQKPFLVPACEQIRPSYEKALKQAITGGNMELVDSIIDKAAFDIEKRCKQIITDLPLIDTGALRNSIQVSDPEGF
jgi:hypothetical protein